MGVHMVHGWRVVGAVMVCILITVSQQSATEDQDSLQTDRQRRSVDGANPFQQLVDALQGENSVTNSDLVRHYTPTTPAPHNINCYVEVPTTVRKGGRCIQLGRLGMSGGSRSRPWACQAGIDLAFSPDCANPRSRGRRPGRG